MAGAGDGNILPSDANEPILDGSNRDIVVSETQPTTCHPPETDSDEVRAMNMVSALLIK